MTRLKERHEIIRTHSPKPPKGGQRFKWYGPGLIWMTASVGSGAVLFTPRIGSRYSYELLWLVPIVVLFMWAMIREVGWYTIATGKTIMDGYGKVPGPRGWAIWLIFLPQVVAGVLTIAGVAALTGSALMIAFPGDYATYTSIAIVLSAILVISGQYKAVEWATSVMAGLLIVAAFVAATTVFPPVNQLAGGIVPGLPEDFDLGFVLPWVGFMLAGSAGIMWFSYWVAFSRKRMQF